MCGGQCLLNENLANCFSSWIPNKGKPATQRRSTSKKKIRTHTTISKSIIRILYTYFHVTGTCSRTTHFAPLARVWPKFDDLLWSLKFFTCKSIEVEGTIKGLTYCWFWWNLRPNFPISRRIQMVLWILRWKLYSFVEINRNMKNENTKQAKL